MGADEIDPFLDEIIKRKAEETDKNEQEMVDLLASEPELSQGSKRVLMYLKNLDGEAEISELETVMKAVPIMDESQLDNIIDTLENADKAEKTGNKVELV